MSATATAYTFDENCFSDLHKDAYGYRPGSNFYEWLQTATDDQKQSMWDDLIVVLERSIAEDNIREKEAIARFEATVATTVASGAADRATAVRWLMAAEDHCGTDVEFFEYLQGIPYGYVTKSLVTA